MKISKRNRVTDGPRSLAVRPAEAASMLGLGLTTIYRLMNDGKLQAHKIGRARLIPIASVEALIGEVR